jgi:hypothetical protein
MRVRLIWARACVTRCSLAMSRWLVASSSTNLQSMCKVASLHAAQNYCDSAEENSIHVIPFLTNNA